MNKLFLLVDDDGDDLELFSEALEEIDKDIICQFATNGREALDLLKKMEKPHLIFLDVNMPVMGGWECLKALKDAEEFRDIPVIIYSTSSHQKERDTAKELGALQFLTKPHDYKELKVLLKGIVELVNKL